MLARFQRKRVHVPEIRDKEKVQNQRNLNIAH